MPRAEQLFAEGSPANDFYYLLDGELEITKRENGVDVVRHTIAAEAMTGQVALMPSSPHSAGARASRPSRLVAIPAEAMRTLLNATAEAGARQMEKLLALGKLAAGLAHELNNPAGAASRASGQCAARWPTFMTWRSGCTSTVSAPEQWEYLQSYQREATVRAGQAEAPLRAGAQRPGGCGSKLVGRARSGQRLAAGSFLHARGPERRGAGRPGWAGAGGGAGGRSGLDWRHARRGRSAGRPGEEHARHLGAGLGDQSLLLHGPSVRAGGGPPRRDREHAHRPWLQSEEGGKRATRLRLLVASSCGDGQRS